MAKGFEHKKIDTEKAELKAPEIPRIEPNEKGQYIINKELCTKTIRPFIESIVDIDFLTTKLNLISPALKKENLLNIADNRKIDQETLKEYYDQLKKSSLKEKGSGKESALKKLEKNKTYNLKEIYHYNNYVLRRQVINDHSLEDHVIPVTDLTVALLLLHFQKQSMKPDKKTIIKAVFAGIFHDIGYFPLFEENLEKREAKSKAIYDKHSKTSSAIAMLALKKLSNNPEEFNKVIKIKGLTLKKKDINHIAEAIENHSFPKEGTGEKNMKELGIISLAIILADKVNGVYKNRAPESLLKENKSFIIENYWKIGTDESVRAYHKLISHLSEEFEIVLDDHKKEANFVYSTKLSKADWIKGKRGGFTPEIFTHAFFETNAKQEKILKLQEAMRTLFNKPYLFNYLINLKNNKLQRKINHLNVRHNQLNVLKFLNNKKLR